MATKSEFKWSPMASGIETAVDETHLWMRIPLTGGQPSKSGKMRLTGSTGGTFTDVPNVAGLRANISVGYKAG